MLSCARYEELADGVEEYVLDMLRDQLNRRQPMDNVSRNLLRLLTATCGYKEVRLMAVQRLEMWLQNPKVGSRCMQTIIPVSVPYRCFQIKLSVLLWHAWYMTKLTCLCLYLCSLMLKFLPVHL